MNAMLRILLVSLALTGLGSMLPGFAQAQNLCVTASIANLRSGPGKEHKIVWEVNRYMPLIQVERQGEWIKVRDVDDELYWVSEQMVSSSIDCVTIRSPHANIRMKPDAGARRWFSVGKYTSFKKTGRKGRWVQIEYEKEVMWVFETLVWPG